MSMIGFALLGPRSLRILEVEKGVIPGKQKISRPLILWPFHTYGSSWNKNKEQEYDLGFTWVLFTTIKPIKP